MFGSSSPFGASTTPSPFGAAATSNPFGATTNPFGTTNQANNPFVAKPFGSTPTPFGGQTGTSLFGTGASTGVFGATQTPTFGASSSAFGGSTSTPAFGAFGQKPASPFGSFGSTTPAQNPFGSPSFGQSQPAFGSQPFGSTTPAFGAQSAPAFGSTNSSLFGSSPSFGASSTPAFGSTPTPAFGASAPAFGASAPAFGSTPAFGQSTPAFGASSTPAFGSTPAASPFGAPAATNTFGSFGGTSFGGQQRVGSRVSPYAVTNDTDAGVGNQPGKFLCISAMPAYKNKSQEELRWEDYQAGDKGAPAATNTFGSFGGTSFGGQQRVGSRVSPYAVTNDTDAGVGNQPGKFLCISAMPAYKNKSQEELRWEDYQAGDKGGPNPASPQQPATGGIFGQSQQTTVSSSPFELYYAIDSSTNISKFPEVSNFNRCGHNFCYSCGSSWSNGHMCMSGSAGTSFAVRSNSDSNSDSDSHATYVVSSISSEEDKDGAHGQEVCQICVDSTPATSPFFCVEGCGHRFCKSCMERHAEARVRDGGENRVTCLHTGCPRTLTRAELQLLLSTKSFELLTTRLTESAIPDHEKVYCPYKDCSTLFVKPADLNPCVECLNCHRGFCVECLVPWHGDGSCAEYKGNLNDKLFDSLALLEKWKRCEKCHYTVERAGGCPHMTCRCGHNFCYNCESSWSDGHVCQSREERNTPIRQASFASNLHSQSRDLLLLLLLFVLTITFERIFIGIFSYLATLSMLKIEEY